jgi:aspartokinase
MVTIAHIVKGMIKDKPFLQEALGKRLIAYGNLAEQILPKIEQELNKKIKHSAVVMALRRYSDELNNTINNNQALDFNCEINLKTNLCAINISKSKKTSTIAKEFYGIVDLDKGDTLNIISGNFEQSIITNEKYQEKILKALKGEKILTKQSNLVSLSLKFPDKFYETPGMIFNIIRQLAWENINIYEIISTHTELSILLKEKDSSKAYECLQSLISKK